MVRMVAEGSVANDPSVIDPLKNSIRQRFDTIRTYSSYIEG